MVNKTSKATRRGTDEIVEIDGPYKIRKVDTGDYWATVNARSDRIERRSRGIDKASTRIGTTPRPGASY